MVFSSGLVLGGRSRLVWLKVELLSLGMGAGLAVALYSAEVIIVVGSLVGVHRARLEPRSWSLALKIDVRITGIGTIINRIVFGFLMMHIFWVLNALIVVMVEISSFFRVLVVELSSWMSFFDRAALFLWRFSGGIILESHMGASGLFLMGVGLVFWVLCARMAACRIIDKYFATVLVLAIIFGVVVVMFCFGEFFCGKSFFVDAH